MYRNPIHIVQWAETTAMAKRKRMPTFIETKFFSADWDRFGLEDDDLRAIQQAIGDDHTVGDVVRGTNGVRKFRMAV